MKIVCINVGNVCLDPSNMTWTNTDAMVLAGVLIATIAGFVWIIRR